MDPVVQSALEAANQGDKAKALDIVKQALSTNPNEIDALLALATFVDEPARKRQVLNRVLSLDPTNKTARETMLELDRAEINSYRPQAPGAPVSPIQDVPDRSLKKPLVFRLSQTGLVLLYFFASISCCATLWFAAIDMTDGFPFLGMTLLLGLTALTISSKVEVNEAGIQTSSVIRSAEIKWNEIASIKTNPWKGILELRSNIGDEVNISTQIRGYRHILEIIQLKRPDLFPQVVSAAMQPIQQPIDSGFVRSADPKRIPTPGTETKPEAATPPLASSTGAQAPIAQPVPAGEKSPPPRTERSAKPVNEKKLTFAYPLFWRIFMYAFPLFFGCIGLLVASQKVLYGLPFLALSLILGLVAAAFSPKVEITEAGIRAFAMLDSDEAQWNEIAQMKPNPMKRRLDLFKANGEFVAISNQVSGYPRIVEIIHQRRPDLFTSSPSPQSADAPASPGRNPATSAEPTFTGVKTFKKNAFGQYGVILLMIPLFLVSVWFLAVRHDVLVGIGISAIVLFFIVMSLFSIHQIRVEPNKLTTESFFAQKEYTARQIKEIQMKTVRSRHGVATNLVSIQPVEGGAISMAGFPEGDEVIYGILQEWWETYRNR